MDHVLRNEVCVEHDESLAIYSDVQACQVCLGCIVETLENTSLLPLQKKPALMILFRVLTYQSQEILQLFMQNEAIVWHIVSALFGNLSADDETYLVLSTDTLLKLICDIKSEDLVNSILENIAHKIKSVVGDHGKLLPYYMLLGKMLFQFPALRLTLVNQYVELVHELSLELCNGVDTVQSAISYIFVFLCDVTNDLTLPVQVLHQVNCGIVNMLSTVDKLPIQINALALLKKLVTDPAGCLDLMSVCVDGHSLVTCMKKLLLCKKDVVQTCVCQILDQILHQRDSQQYSVAILEEDLAEFLFEALNTENTVQIECIMGILQALSSQEQFYKRCHAVYGMESILRALSTSEELKNPSLVRQGFVLLTDILNRHPDDSPLFLSSSVVNKCVSVIRSGLEHQQSAVFNQALYTFTALVRKKYLLSPVPFLELSDLITLVTGRVWKEGSRKSGVTRKGHQKTEEYETVLGSCFELLIRCTQLIQQCRGDVTSCDSNFSAPDSRQCAPIDTFSCTMLQACEHTFVPLTMQFWESASSAMWYVKCLEMLCGLQHIDAVKSGDILHKLVVTDFLNRVLDVKIKYNVPALCDVAARFLETAIRCCQMTGILARNVDYTALINPNMLTCSVDNLCAVLESQPHNVEMVQSYLLLLYLAFKHNNRIISGLELSNILTVIAEEHHILQQMSSPARKHFVYLLAWVNVSDGTDRQLHVSHEEICHILEGSTGDWYTHDIILLQWCFQDPILSALAGKTMLGAFIEQSSLEAIQSGFCSVETCPEAVALLQLCECQQFIRCLVSSMSTSVSDDVYKVRTLLEEYICTQTEADRHNDTSMEMDNVHEEDRHICMLDVIFETVSETLNKIFLQAQAGDHSIAALLEILLMVGRPPNNKQIESKILCKVLNTVSRFPALSIHLQKACLLTILAAVSTQQQQTTCAMVVQHEDMMCCIQDCIVGKYGDMLYCIAFDLLCVFLQYPDLKTSSCVTIDICKITHHINNSSLEVIESSMSILEAMYHVSLQHPCVRVQRSLTHSQYRSLYIQLQQMCLQEYGGLSSCAAVCMIEMMNYLEVVSPNLGMELLCQSWNTLLVDVITDMVQENILPVSHLSLISMFVEKSASSCVVKSNHVQLRKLVACLKKLKDGSSSSQYPKPAKQLSQQILTHFKDVLSIEDVECMTEIPTLDISATMAS